jgi:hypothetical protein
MQLLMQASQLRDHLAVGLESAREAVNCRFLNQAQALNLPTGVCWSIREAMGETS